MVEKLTSDAFRDEKMRLTPKTGFNLVGIDYFESPVGQLYLIEHFEMYQDALRAKQDREDPEEYFVLYKDARDEFCCR